MRLSHIFVILIVILLALCGLLVSLALRERMVMLYVVEGLIGICIVFVLLFYFRLVRPMRTMVTSLDLLREQDFSSRLRYVGQYEVDKVIDVFNPMMEALKQSTLKMKERRHVFDQVFKASPMGIVMIDAEGQAVSNPAAKKMIGDEHSELSQKLRQLATGTSEVVRLSNAEVYRCSHLSYMDSGFAHSFYMIESITSVVGLAEQRAYEKVIRTMAHEVNNTVCGVNSTLDAIGMVLDEMPDAQDMAEAVEACQQRTSALSDFVTRYASIVKVPQPELAETSVKNFVEGHQLFLETMCRQNGVEMSIRSDGDFTAQIDASLFDQALINIIKNAIESPGTTEVIIEITAAERRLSVIDNGQGISDAAAHLIFSPFFTTKPSGQGLGLMLVQRILSDHSTQFSLSTSPLDHLTRFSIIFP